MNQIIRNNLPCFNCICLAMCKNKQTGVIKNIGPFLTNLSQHCSLLLDYLTLKDLGLDARDIDVSLPMSKRKHITMPLAKRIIEIVEFMKWDYDLTRDRLMADGLLPSDEE